ncbi:DUF3219 family protein [Metabacillus litoralis]|uniref:DUF3219 family protein n=1 Tax=Metabacillus litoralis TaxID=152268 RepID=UPI001CFE8576|nr:DUF3219 family protein [Metabacillus litoralis]
MINEIIIDGKNLAITNYKEKTINGLVEISIQFNVLSEDYHNITTLLYKDTFHITVPEKNTYITAKITQYSTSITNLYNKEQTGIFKVRFSELMKEGR